MDEDDDDPYLPWEGPIRGFDKPKGKIIEGTKATKHVRAEDGVTVIDLSAYSEANDRDDDYAIFDTQKRFLKDKRAHNLKQSESLDDGNWTRHTEYHWSRDLCGKRLDYWPSRNKFQWNKGRIIVGDVFGFIRNRERECHDGEGSNQS